MRENNIPHNADAGIFFSYSSTSTRSTIDVVPSVPTRVDQVIMFI